MPTLEVSKITLEGSGNQNLGVDNWFSIAMHPISRLEEAFKIKRFKNSLHNEYLFL